MELEIKIKEAERTLKLAAEMSEYYYHKPLIICYSGGKDSDVMLDIAKKCLKPSQFEVLNSHTTVDAPETVYHIRAVFKDLEAQGVKTTVRMPMFKGERTSMWKLIEQKSMPPTRTRRYCCAVLKEASTPNRMVAVGVREAESKGRQGRGEFGVLGRRKADGEYRSLGHTYAMFQMDRYGGEDVYQCEMIKACKKNKDTIVNPIYYFTEADIWDYIKAFNVKTNPLYCEGFKRVGCVGCPMAGGRTMLNEFARWPQYKTNYIKAFDRMQKNNEAKGIFNKIGIRNGEEWFEWWIGGNPNQLKIDDLTERTE